MPARLIGRLSWRDRRGRANYFAAVALPLAAILLAVQLTLPPFVFEHLIVLLIVALAMLGGRGPVIVGALTATIGDDILLREPVGRPTITGARDVIDLALFIVVGITVGWLVSSLRTAREEALAAAARERRAREERDRVVATVTHDLATPLTAIQGTIQFARKNEALSSLDLPRLFVRMETAAARATSLVRTLADARSIDGHAFRLTMHRHDLREIVEPTVRMLDRLSERHPVALALPPAPLLLQCDAERLGRVFENLISNAIKYSPQGGAVEVHVGEEEGAAVVTVADYGIGIPASDRERLFEAGYRTTDAATTAPGLGLGLYIASEIVQRHGGTISLAAREGGGTLFIVRLPLVETGSGGDRGALRSASAETHMAS